MNLVTAEHLTKSYTERLILNDTDFSINEGDKIGLIGVNGTGKSTLLKLVAGLEEPDTGPLSAGGTWISAIFPRIRCLRREKRSWKASSGKTGAGIMTRSGTWKARQRPC